MRYFFALITILSSSLFAFGQTFFIETILITDSTQFKKPEDFVRLDSVFFQDDNYYVRRTCSGEWGGSVWFKNKSTGIEYSCSATCPRSINKIDNKYIVTSSLGHGEGSSKIIEIEFPDSMSIFKQPKPKIEKKGRKRIIHGYYPDEFESKSSKGTKVLVDTIFAMVFLSFPYEDQLYHIVSDSKTLYLSQIKNNKLVTVDTIYSGLDNFYKRGEGVLSGYRTEGFKTKENHYVVLFENRGLVGFLEIFENNIRITRYQ
jgi:hypothetical protein